jgi:outer membrane receptor protein involved in Fe transport
LLGRVTGVVFGAPDAFGKRMPYLMRAMGRLSGMPSMVVIVDGMIMSGNNLDEINSNDVSSIEVLRSGAYLAIYGSNAPGGALVITTKRGDELNYVTSETPSGIITYPFNGFYKARTFYTPKYTASKTTTQAADLRNTIFWKPNIVTDKDGKASFEYVNNDTKGTYRVVVEGIDDNGNLGRQVYRYRVE